MTRYPTPHLVTLDVALARRTRCRRTELELGATIAELAKGRRFAFAMADVVKAMVFGRVLHPGSERALITTWLSTVAMPEFDGVELQHAYRALAFVAEMGAELEARLARC